MTKIQSSLAEVETFGAEPVRWQSGPDFLAALMNACTRISTIERQPYEKADCELRSDITICGIRVEINAFVRPNEAILIDNRCRVVKIVSLES